jgi:DNA-binding transcriptional ArsR family regulator
MPKSLVNPLDRLFVALADATRRDVVARLAAEGSITVGALAAAYPMALPSFTQHLEMLERADVIQTAKVGRQRHVALCPRAFEPLVDWVLGTVPLGPTPVLHVTVTPTTGPTRPTGAAASALAKAEALLRDLAPGIAVIERALALQDESGVPEGFSPSVHAACRLAAMLREYPPLAAELREALSLYRRLQTQVKAADLGGPIEPLRGTSLPLGRIAYSWQANPALSDVLAEALPSAR